MLNPNWKLLLLILSLSMVLELFGEPTQLNILNKKITVHGKEVEVLSIVQPDGTFGLRVQKGNPFDVLLKNTMSVPTSVHWHGIILPNNQDGVAFITQFPQYPGLTYHYKFPLVQTGTYWMHSHYGLQEQRLLSAPLIIYDFEDEKMADQEAILFLVDFSFKTPSEIFQALRGNKKDGMNMKTPSQDVVEVDYDAFLINYKSAEDPDILKVEPGKKVRLRVINGASATNFFISLGNLEGEVIAVDGNRIKPLRGSNFELAVAQRIDIILTIPKEGDFFLIQAQGEGTDKQAIFVLTTANAIKSIPQLTGKASEKVGPLTNEQEKHLHPLNPLEKRSVDNRVNIELGGDMHSYVWTLNGQAWPEVTPIVVEKGQRVEIIFKNKTTMSHPMHLHGHVFQVTAINEKPIEGAMRDTVLVMPNSSITIQFDANNPGVWPLHCHILYHLEAGMFTVVRYKDFLQPL